MSICRAQEEAYSYYGTGLDNKDHLDYSTGQKTPETALAAATLAGRMVLRLVHDHRLPLDLSRNVAAIDEPVSKLVRRIAQLTKVTITHHTQGPRAHRLQPHTGSTCVAPWWGPVVVGLSSTRLGWKLPDVMLTGFHIARSCGVESTVVL